MDLRSATSMFAILALAGPVPARQETEAAGQVDASDAAARARLEALLPDRPARARRRAFAQVTRSKDPRFLAPMADLLRFASTEDEWVAIMDCVAAILGRELAGDEPWSTLTRFLADRDTVELPPGYAQWKGDLLGGRVDPRMRDFLHDGVTSRVRLDEIVWGGVTVDGIPALVDPAAVPAAEADYLGPDEPVFGVELGGEARAYPLRILDWHEMANDTLGGVPFALAY